ncbi:hypothetical protein [Streptomyces fructofermentans]|uniref:Lipoprotein n=1 Tax=Streptomyces fructofermentans TaxID=152141 RepID=A0A918KUC5_9ACTN|nr:hypothetical protein [Streptomyces fructofermentans]GGX77403.1 lipoprotein [Streptomyces fructofermentans]
MNRPPRPTRRGVRVAAPALAAAALLATAACSADDGDAQGGTARSAAPAAGEPTPPSPSVTVARTLTEAQVRTALISPGDLGPGWAGTQGAATWRDALLKGRVEEADCRRLLDGLYTESLLGEPAGARAVLGFDNSGSGAQLRHQAAAYDRAALDESLAWLAAVPRTCPEFTATDAAGNQYTVRVEAAAPPTVGEAGAGLHVSVTGGSDEVPAALTLDFAAVRVGDSALSLTNGGLTGADTDATLRATEAGTRRLQEVLDGGTPAARPSVEQG